MRITNGMIRNNVLWSINKNEELMQNYELQLSTGKKIQKPSDNPIVAVRALKFKTNISEIAQYKTNSEDAISWLSVTEQSMGNTYDLLSRVRELAVQATSDTYSSSDRATIIEELEQIKTQLANEGNVNYAGRYVFTGYKTDKPLTFTSDTSDTYDITENLSADDIETTQRIVDNNIIDVPRIRLAYSDIGTSSTVVTDPSNNGSPYGMAVVNGIKVIPMLSTDTSPLPEPADQTVDADAPPAGEAYFHTDTGAIVFNGADTPISVVTMQSTDDTLPAAATGSDPYSPSSGEVYYHSDTGELIFNSTETQSTINGKLVIPMNSTDETVPAPATGVSPFQPAEGEVYLLQDTGELIFNEADTADISDFSYKYEKSNFVKGDMVPEQYFNCVNKTTGSRNEQTVEEMIYQISYNQDIVVNTMGNELITSDLLRDMEELINVVENIGDDDSIEQTLQEDLLGDYFDRMIGKMDEHIDTVTREEAQVGSKINTLELTINRLEEDNINFTDLLSKNEDADMTEAVLNLQAQELVYNASLMSSSNIMQQTLLDFIS